ncbi:hypothetical protein B0A49_02132 [Cryomyces minteri]|uniref:Altered inheritance of mitochondria protein 41 n=1 Tax=Cryomyces minteri TaxID=331657 RepID=A0A4U0XU94_9PEZI|nr:hypothetical protein B0A49_02132 [Cryomyces minteri]
MSAPTRSLPRLSRLSRPFRCTYATTTTTSAGPPAPPLLLKLRGDLKSAMKAKDTNRLNVLRSLLAEVTNAAKTTSPIKSDMQLLSLLRKRASASKAAAEEFRAQGREDLGTKEEGQVGVLEEYAGGVETVAMEEVERVVGEVVQTMKGQGEKLNLGAVLKRLVGPGGAFEGRPVETKEVARVVKDVLGSS